jgi:hypothetical protein
MRPGHRTIAFVGAGGLYLTALFLPAVNPFFGPADPRYPPFPGHKALRLGAVLLTRWEANDPFFGLKLLAVTGWMANPAVWIAFATCALRRWWWTRLFAGIGMALALSPLPFPKGADALAGQPGYWAWAGSAMILVAVGWHARASRGGTGGPPR